MASDRMTGEGARSRLQAPPGAVETHSHIYGPESAYPVWPGREPHPDASVEAYTTMLGRLGIERAVIVQPSAYGPDNRCTLDAIRKLGLDRARGVAVTRPDVSEAELRDLHAQGIRGMRFFLLAEDLGLDVIEEVARKIEPLGWHVQVQGDGRHIGDWIPILEKLPVETVIDHIGRLPPECGVDSEPFRAFLKFVETGRCWVKLSGPYYGSTEGPPRYADVTDRVRALVEARPDRMVWAANWPHPGFPLDGKPDDAALFDLMSDWVPDDATRRVILVDNPAKLYDFD